MRGAAAFDRATRPESRGEMEEMTPQLMALFVSTGVGVWMALAGVQKSALEWKRRRRTCRSCARTIAGRTCASCAHVA